MALYQAHRGLFSNSARENSREAFLAAIDQGIKAVELDAQVSHDGALVVNHDLNLLRFYNDPRKIADVGSQELDERFEIPTLKSVIDEFGRDLFFNIEVKTSRSVLHISRTILALRTFLKETHGAQFLISSFNPTVILSLQYLFPYVPRAFLLEGDSWAQALIWQRMIGWGFRPQILNWPEELMTPELCRENHDRGYLVGVWTVKTVARARELQEMGVDHLICDPQVFTV